MADQITQDRHGRLMSRVRNKDTSPELRVRSYMHRAGYRYRLHVADMPGTPDIVMPRYRMVNFVNGCFWHRHQGCYRASVPKTNAAFWERKFKTNVVRDERSRALLQSDGWAVSVVRECQTLNRQTLADTLANILPPRIPVNEVPTLDADALQH